MKGLLACLIACSAPFAFAVDAPRGSFSPKEIAEANAEAQKTGKPLAVIITDTKSSCPKCQAGNAEAFRRMKSDYVLVVSDQAKKDSLPADLQRATNPTFAKKGNFIPIVTVLSPEKYDWLGGLCYNQISKDGRKAFTTLEKEVEEASLKLGQDDKGDPAPADEPAPAAEASGEMRDWTNSAGATIRAAVLGSSGGKVTFKLENGKVVDYPIHDLSKESQEIIKGGS